MMRKKLLSVLMCGFMVGSLLTSVTVTAETAAEDAQGYESMDEGLSIESGSIEMLELVDDGSGEILPLEGVGPNGETPVGVDALKDLLDEASTAKIKEGGYTCAVVLGTMSLDWSQLQMKGIKATLDQYNVELIAAPDCKNDVTEQVAAYESVIEADPDILITLPLDSEACGPYLEKAVEKGIVVTLIDSVPIGFEAGVDYCGMVTADNYANGRAGAEAIIDAIGSEGGKVAMLSYKNSAYHSDARQDAARELFESTEGIELVDEQLVLTPEEAASAAESMLVAHPDLKGIWACWDAVGTAAAGVIENMGSECVVATVDLGYDCAYMIADDESPMVSTGAQHPYDQGIAETLMGLAALSGKEVPAFVLVPAEKVTKDSMVRSWNRVFREEMDDQIKELLNIG